jgi:predicted lipoprotein with Yx(FWY)xxD motif
MVVTLAACGGGDGGNGGTAGAANGAAISVTDVGGAKTLVDASGKTLYFADQEAGGAVKCVQACLNVWIPATGTADAAKAVDGAGVQKRADTGAEQLTYQGKPLYTFKLDDGPGKTQGNGAKDAFGGTDFTWHAATTSGTTSSSNNGGGGYGY